jgi:hypothetical protein
VARATPLLLAVFSAAAAILLVVTGLSLLIPGGPLDVIWGMAENKRAFLLPYGGLVGPAFLLRAIVSVVASVGCYRRRRWGWWIAVAALAANGIGDAAQTFAGRPFEGIFGVAIAALILFWLTRKTVRNQFSLAAPPIS